MANTFATHMATSTQFFNSQVTTNITPQLFGTIVPLQMLNHALTIKLGISNYIR